MYTRLGTLAGPGYQFIETVRTTRDPDAIAVLTTPLDADGGVSDAAAEALRYLRPVFAAK